MPSKKSLIQTLKGMRVITRVCFDVGIKYIQTQNINQDALEKCFRTDGAKQLPREAHREFFSPATW